jgi:hypothetical protein
MHTINHTKIARVSNEKMKTLGSDDVKFDNVFFLVIDDAP